MQCQRPGISSRTTAMDDLDNLFESRIDEDLENQLPYPNENNKDKDEDILGLDQEVKVKTRKKLITLNDTKLLSRNGIPYLYENRKKLRYLHSNKSDYNPKDYTTHYTYKNLSTILEYYQLWAHKLFPKLRFKDAIMLANRKTSGDSKRVKFYRESMIEAEIKQLFPEESVDVAGPSVDDLDVVLSDTELSTTQTREHNIDAEDNETPLVPRSNGIFVGEDFDEDDNDLYTTTKTVEPSKAQDEPVNTVAHTLSDDEFNDDDQFNDQLVNVSSKRRNRAIVDDEEDEEIPNPEEFEQNHDDELEMLREMGM